MRRLILIPGDFENTGGVDPVTHLPNRVADTFGDYVYTTGGAFSQLTVALGNSHGGYEKSMRRATLLTMKTAHRS